MTSIKELLITGNDIPFVESKASFSKVLSVIASKRLGCALVKDKKFNRISIVTDGDTARAASKFRNISSLKVSEFMNKNPKYINENTLATEALSIMNAKRITILLVKSKSRFKGLVSLHSILEYLGK